MAQRTKDPEDESITSSIELPADQDDDETVSAIDGTPDCCELLAENVSFGYQGGADPIIDNETLQIPSGSVTTLVGPNGSGKSTLLKGLANQVGQSTGSVLLDGREISSFEPKVLARKLGLLSQENVSPGNISVEKLVEHGRYPHRDFFDSMDQTDHDAIERAISLTGIEHLRKRDIGSLSGGQKQLVWIAMVLAQETDVLLLDEPTTFLDLHHKLEVMKVIRTLRDERDITIVVVLHDIERAARIADHMVALKDGSVKASGVPEEVITEDLLAAIFDIKARVGRTQYGLQITPLEPLSTGELEK